MQVRPRGSRTKLWFDNRNHARTIVLYPCPRSIATAAQARSAGTRRFWALIRAGAPDHAEVFSPPSRPGRPRWAERRTLTQAGWLPRARDLIQAGQAAEA